MSRAPTLGVAAAALAWGLWWLPLRYLEGAGLSGDWASVAIYGVTLLALLPGAALRRGRWRAGGWPLLGAGLLFGGTLASWNHAVITGEVVRVSLLFYLAPVWSTALATGVLGERLTAYRVGAVLLGLAGAAIVLGLGDGLPLPQNGAEWMGLAAGVMFAFAMTFARRGGGDDWFETALLSLAAGTGLALLMAFALPVGAPPDNAALARVLPALLAAALVWHLPIVALTLWGAGRLGPARVSILLLLEIAAATVSAALFAGEPFGWREAVGCVLILAAGGLDGLAEMGRPAVAGTGPPPK